MTQRNITERSERQKKKTGKAVPITGKLRNKKTKKSKIVHNGIAVVPGIAIGRLHIKFLQTSEHSDRKIDEDEIEYELERLTEAVRISKEDLMIARKKVAVEIGEVEATIFDTHIALFEDKALIGKIKDVVVSDRRPVEVVVSEIVEGYYKTLSMVEDANIRERAADIRDVGRRLLTNLSALVTTITSFEDSQKDQISGILFAKELFPSDLALIDKETTLGVISEKGSDRGHCAVILRSMGIPCVMGLDDMTEIINDNDLVIIDGSEGQVYVNPTIPQIAKLEKKQKEFEIYNKALAKENKLEPITKDNETITLLSNISQAGELPITKIYNSDGIGLYRTEFELMMHSDFPDEEKQFLLYAEMVKGMGDLPITFRTIDIGSEKELSYLDIPKEENHALGLRSIRLTTIIEEYLLIQIKAILRASVFGNVQLMVPFITNIEDIRYVKKLVRRSMRDLQKRGLKYDSSLPIGMMVEVPTVAMSLEKYAKEVSFLSVGTNDLTQYMCAADRSQTDVSYWYCNHNPGILAMLKHIVDVAKKTKTPLSICGEMAGDPIYTMFLIGIGATTLSMSSPQMPLVKKIIRSMTINGAKKLSDRVLSLSTTSQIGELLYRTIEQTIGKDLAYWIRQRTS